MLCGNKKMYSISLQKVANYGKEQERAKKISFAVDYGTCFLRSGAPVIMCVSSGLWYTHIMSAFS